METRIAAARYSKLPESVRGVRRTISVTAWRISRFSPLKVELPECVIQGTPWPEYDADLAWALLSRTAELHSSRSGMLALLHEYRYALHDVLAADPGRETGDIKAATRCGEPAPRKPWR
jgi:hypothetical protein